MFLASLFVFHVPSLFYFTWHGSRTVFKQDNLSLFFSCERKPHVNLLRVSCGCKDEVCMCLVYRCFVTRRLCPHTYLHIYKMYQSINLFDRSWNERYVRVVYFLICRWRKFCDLFFLNKLEFINNIISRTVELYIYKFNIFHEWIHHCFFICHKWPLELE